MPGCAAVDKGTKGKSLKGSFMSNYRNFVEDFPKRCDDLLDKLFPRAKAYDREVTLMFSIATAGFVIPFGRLREKDHPARDRKRYQEAAAKLDEILNAPFLGSPLWAEQPATWLFAKEVEDEGRELDCWPELTSPQSLPKDAQAKNVLAPLRNGLAHGNIFTRGNPIDLLVFLSKPYGAPKYVMVAVSPFDFHVFLRNWFSFLASLQIPVGLCEGAMVA